MSKKRGVIKMVRRFLLAVVLGMAGVGMAGAGVNKVQIVNGVGNDGVEIANGKFDVSTAAFHQIIVTGTIVFGDGSIQTTAGGSGGGVLGSTSVITIASMTTYGTITTTSAIIAGSLNVTGTSGSSISTTNDQLTVQTVGGVLQVNNSSWTFNNYTQENSTKTWGAQQTFSSVAIYGVEGSSFPILSISTGGSDIFKVSGSSIQIGNGIRIGFGTDAPTSRFDFVGGSVTVRNGGVSARGTMIGTSFIGVAGLVQDFILNSNNNSPLILQTDGSERMRILGSGGRVGIGTSDPSSRLDVYTGSITARSASGDSSVGISMSSITIRSVPGTPAEVFTVSTGTTRLFAVYGSSINCGVPLNTNVPGASWGFEMAKSMSLNDFKKFVNDNGHLPTVQPDSSLNSGLTDIGNFASRLLATNEMLAHYVGELEERIRKLEGR